MATNAANDTGLKHIWDKIIALLSNKVDKETGKGLSTNDYTTAEKDLVATIPDKADASDILGAITITGNPITLTDGSETYAEELSVDLESIQDLHGYDKPWVGGAGKNKIGTLVSNVVYNNSGASAVVFDNDKITWTTGSGYYAFLLKAFEITSDMIGKQFVFSYQSTPAMTEFTRFVTCDSSCNNRVERNNPITITNAMVGLLLTIRFYSVEANTYNISNIQVEEGTTATSYAPYSNISPIQGYDIVNLDRTGINLWDEQWEIGAINYLDGENSTNANKIRAKNLIPVTSGVELYFKPPAGTDGLNVYYYDRNGKYINYTEIDSSNNHKWIVPNYVGYFRITTYGSSITTYNHDISINYPSTDTNYHTFTGNDRISLQLGNKNLLPMTVEGIKAFNTDGTWSGNVYTHNGVTYSLLTNSEGNIIGIKVNGTATASVNFWLVKDYTFKPGSYIITDDCALKGNYQPYVFVEGSTATNNTNRSATYITNVDIQKNIGIWMSTSSGANNVILYPMVRKASVVDPTFSPYNPTLGGMVYGGQLTLKDDGSAVFVGDRVCLTANEDATGALSNYPTNRWQVRVYQLTTLSTTADNTKLVCDRYKTEKNTSGTSNCWLENVNNATMLYFNTVTAYSSFNDMVSACGYPTFTVPLATPFALYLSAEQIKLLQGTNNIWSNAGDVTLKYQPDNVIAEPKADVQRLRDDVDLRLIDNAPKNLLKNNITSFSQNGITVTRNNDSSVTLKGTATGTVWVEFYKDTSALPEQMPVNEDLIVSCIDSNTESAKNNSHIEIFSRINGAWVNTATVRSNKEAVFQIPAEASGLMIRTGCFSGNGYYDYTMYPMVRRAGITDGSYEEYYPSNRELYNKTLVNKRVYVPITSANAWINTGMSITIPANSFYAIHAVQFFNNSRPSGILLSYNATDSSKTYEYTGIGNYGSCYVCDYTTGDTTLYLYIKGESVNATGNDCRIMGWYEPALYKDVIS